MELAVVMQYPSYTPYKLRIVLEFHNQLTANTARNRALSQVIARVK